MPDPKEPMLAGARRAKGDGAIEEAKTTEATPAEEPTPGTTETTPAADETEPVSEASAEAQPEGATRYFAGVFPGVGHPLPAELGDAAAALAAAFDAPVWLLLQNYYGGSLEYGTMSEEVRDGFFAFRDRLAECERVVLVVDSPGGQAAAAYKIGRLFQRHCGGWSAVVPRYAKSAATLLVMGADRLYMGRDAELGPLDAQLMDPEREEITSALDEVQALERMHSSAMSQIDETMQLLIARTGKKVETLLPVVTKFVSDTMAPLLDKIDTVHYSQQSRVLKVAEDYAFRLLLKRVPRAEAEHTARHFVNHYNEHGFVIDVEEAGHHLDVVAPDDDQAAAIARMEEWLTAHATIAIGPLITVTEETEDAEEEES